MSTNRQDGQLEEKSLQPTTFFFISCGCLSNSLTLWAKGQVKWLEFAAAARSLEKGTSNDG